MKLPKILYWVTREEHKRVFMPFCEDPRVNQAVSMKDLPTSGMNLQNIYKFDKIRNVIEHFKPDVFVQTDIRGGPHKMLKRNGVKLVFIGHGVWAKTKRNINKWRKPGHPWNNFDLFCCGTNRLGDILRKKTKAEIISNALPQFDLLYDLNQKNKIFQDVGIKTVDKVISLFSHKTSGQPDIACYNEEYYRTAIVLSNLAEQNNWFVFIKPKNNKSKNYLEKLASIKSSKYDWAREIIKEYVRLENKTNVLFLPPHSEAYKYMCASDVIITTGRSTVEIEASLINKPLIKICTFGKNSQNYNIHGTLTYNAAHIVKNLLDLNEAIETVGNTKNLKSNQNKFIKHLGLTLDGQAHNRVLNKIIRMLNIYGWAKWKVKI